MGGDGISAKSRACGEGRLIDNELAEVGEVLEGDRVFGKKVLGWWIRGEDMETFPEDLFEAERKEYYFIENS